MQLRLKGSTTNGHKDRGPKVTSYRQGADQEIDPRRSALMRRVRGKDTSPEKAVRAIAHSLGLRYRLHRRDLPGSPDLVFPRHKKVIFVHGCFWHRHPGCPKATVPKTRYNFWVEKFERNISRDEEVQERLSLQGWDVLVLWECEIKNVSIVEKKLSSFFDIYASECKGKIHS